MEGSDEGAVAFRRRAGGADRDAHELWRRRHGPNDDARHHNESPAVIIESANHIADVDNVDA
jgi:hypothetical protein